MAAYLDFEKSVEQIFIDINEAKSRGDTEASNILQDRLHKEVSKVFTNLTEYQKLQLARHPDRPYALDYVRAIMDDPIEIHGDRAFSDDPAIVSFMGSIDGQKTIIIGEQKGRGVKNKLKRNFGMPQPDGYRKALRISKLAEKFQIPILFLIDTPGAYPGIGAEERGQSEAIAKNLFELSDLDTITISVVIGEGGSGGALAIGVADRLAMMRYSVFSVISPEGCAAILWNDPKKQEQATKAMKITSSDLEQLNLIDDIIDEPLAGGHRDRDGATSALKKYFLSQVKELRKLSREDRLKKRYNKLVSHGAFSNSDEDIDQDGNSSGLTSIFK
jgi:acetyl-CoA carboxylase carboxyl transferase subunit alpha